MRARMPGIEKLFGKESARFFEAIELFNKGEFWESHEVFEDVWRMQEGEVKKLTQGFIQAAAGFSFIRLKRYESVIYLFDKSVEKLRLTAHLIPEVHVDRLVKAIGVSKVEVQRLGKEGLERFDPALYPRIELSLQTPKSRRSRVTTNQRKR